VGQVDNLVVNLRRIGNPPAGIGRAVERSEIRPRHHATTPESVVAFRPSDALPWRVADLTKRAKAGSISPQDLSELEDCLQLEHIMVMAKARARQRIQLGQ